LIRGTGEAPAMILISSAYNRFTENAMTAHNTDILFAINNSRLVGLLFNNYQIDL